MRIEPPLSRARGPRRVLTMGPSAADLGRRRFRLRQGPAREALEEAERSYVFGFNAVLCEDPHLIDVLPIERRGFAYEGAGAACTTLDLLTMTRGRRLHELLAGPAVLHQHSVHLGAGRAYARLHLRPMWGVRRTHPLLRWAAVDGFGFQRGLAQADRMVGERSMPNLLTRTQCAIFDQGLGRMLWFHDCASPEDVGNRIGEFATGRRADLWSGVGFAAAHVGGADLEELSRVAAYASADGFRSHLAQGAVFATAIRLTTGTVPDHTAQAVHMLAGAEPEEAATWADRALITLGHDPHTHDDYQSWRAQTRRSWARRNR